MSTTLRTGLTLTALALVAACDAQPQKEFASAIDALSEPLSKVAEVAAK
jgi:hypothetical protein